MSSPAPTDTAISGLPRRPAPLLTQNRELKPLGIWNWTLPAWAGRLPDGRTYNTCPCAGVCRQVCYARHGTYTWPVVKARHQANLAFVLDDLPSWQTALTAELARPRFTGRWVRIHDSGDFFSDPYLTAWLQVMAARPQVRFYAYTKEVDRFRRLVEPAPPANFRWVYSYGGTQDTTLDPATDRVADVFPDQAAIAAAGWHSQDASDLLAVLGPAPVGVPANRIPHLRRRQAGRTFRTWQATTDATRRTPGGRRHLAAVPPAAPTGNQRAVPRVAGRPASADRRAA
ncbi:MAG TPA: hypothetical protein VMU51_09485 [Mycobacteriales bacterium]|nr:hypothetical protein [Mycobacteriales bacterium]